MENENKRPDPEPQDEQKPVEGNAITRLYDKLPFTFRQVDIAVKVLVGLTVVLLIVGIIIGNP